MLFLMIMADYCNALPEASHASTSTGGFLIWSAAARYSATPLSSPIDSITSQSGVPEYLAPALQIKTLPKHVAARFVERSL